MQCKEWDDANSELFKESHDEAVQQCKEWDDANSELFKESHDEAVHKISYKSRLYELISASIQSV